MGVFFILLVFPIIWQHVKVGNSVVRYKKKSIEAIAIFFSILTVLVMFRHESVGTDTPNYIYYFNKYSNLAWNNIYKGALGEVVGKYILEKNLGVSVKEIDDPALFELFDYEIEGTSILFFYNCDCCEFFDFSYI